MEEEMKRVQKMLAVCTLVVFAISLNPAFSWAATPDGGVPPPPDAAVSPDASASAPTAKPTAKPAPAAPACQTTSPKGMFVCVESDGFITAATDSKGYACQSGKLVRATQAVLSANAKATAKRAKSVCKVVPPRKKAKVITANAAAIRAAQKKCGIKADGLLGPRTRECLRQLAGASASAKKRAKAKAKGVKVYVCGLGTVDGTSPEWRAGPFICADNSAAALRHLPRGSKSVCGAQRETLGVVLDGGRYAACPPTRVPGGVLAAKEGATPFYHTWWFWTAVGVAVAGGAAAAAYYGSRPNVVNDYRSASQSQGLRF